MQEWRNWQTRTVQVRVSIALMRVQVPFPAFLMEEDKLIAYRFIFFRFGAPGGARFLRVQVPSLPGSGKDIAEGKGVHREVESEGSWMWGTY